MASIVRGQANTSSKVNWFITVGGTLNDAYEVGFRILDITAGLPGTQIFPTTPGEYEEVTVAPGRFGVGRYHAYDNASAAGWTPGLAASLGTYRIVWRWKIDAVTAYQSGQEDFEVLAEDGVAPPDDTYCSVQDIRDEGITAAMADDARVLAYIATWQELLDRACRQWFLPKTLTLVVDGNDADTLFFGVPIIDVDYVKLNDSTVELETTYYRVYNSRVYPDDRRNPKISLIGPSGYRDIYTAPVTYGRLKFRKGRQNQEIKGTFGFTEPDDSVPEMIRRALIKLVIEKLSKPAFTDPAAGSTVPSAPPILGPLLMERTDDHTRRYGAGAGADVKNRRPGISGVIEDPEVRDIVKLYRAPLGLASPSHWSYG